MARQIFTHKDAEIIESAQSVSSKKKIRYLPDSRNTPDSSVGLKPDRYFDRLLKYIPAEVVAGYIFILGTIQQLSDPGKAKVIHWLVFILFCLITFIYLLRVLKVRKLQQLFISVLSFIVWVFALGGPFTFLGWYDPLYGQILLPVFTFAAALWEAGN